MARIFLMHNYITCAILPCYSMTYETKFGATARMNLRLIAGSLVTVCSLLFGILKLVEND